MKILIAHNHYGDYVTGGEATVTREEAELLRLNGHDVRLFECSNSEIARMNPLGKIRAFKNITWSPLGYKMIAEALDEFKPDLMHVVNYKFLLSPSVFAAAKDKNIPTALSLHNYRLVCPAGQFLCRGKVCEDCLNGNPYRIMWRRCLSNSPIKNLMQLQLYLGTRKRHFLAPWVDAYIASTEFGRRKFIEGGLPADKVHVKPPYASILTTTEDTNHKMHGAISVGRLSPEKGLKTLIKAWQNIDYPLTIVGDGPLRVELESMAPASVTFVGEKSRQDVFQFTTDHAFSIFSSECYEGFGISLLEAMSVGKPIIAGNLGGRPEVVEDGRTGLLYENANPIDLAAKVQFLIDNPELVVKYGEAARKKYFSDYTAKVNYEQLMAIYTAATESHLRATTRLQ